MVSQSRKGYTMSEYRKQFAKLSQSEMVRRAVRATPRNNPPSTDDRFVELLNQLE